VQLREAVEEAFLSIQAGVLRAALTMLGIVIGVAAVITMVALGTGARRAIDERISALGAGLLTVFPGQRYHRGVATSAWAPLSADDARALARDARLLAAVVPELSQAFQVEYGRRNVNLNIVGSSADYPEVGNFSVRFGRSFSVGEDRARRRVAVLGAAVPDLLEQNAAALIHQTLFIRDIPFEIIGVFDPKGSQASWHNPDEQIVIPLETAQYRVFGSGGLRTITVQVDPAVPVEQGMIDIERVLRREHGIPPGGENDFTIHDRQELLQTQHAASEVFAALLASIAAVSLLVGGIGIMNIMLVSVTERTREIGIRKALGATRLDILVQFLVEALVLCLVGGLLGVLAGSVGALALARLAGWNTAISAGAVALAFAFSAAVGVFFGLWPARRAAALEPIDALRRE
jgi:putative ABC transport system permease protein